MSSSGRAPFPRLGEALAAVEWSEASDWAQTEVHHLYRQSGSVGAFADVLDSFAPVRKAWLSCVEPGGFLADHIDEAKSPGYWERWHVPLEPAGLVLHNCVLLDQQPGIPCRFEHWLPHAAANPTSRRRITLIIDRAVIVQPPGPFQRLVPSPQIAELIPR